MLYDGSKFNCFVEDGIQWDLFIEFSNGRKKLKICGDNAFPYNFRDLMSLLEVDESLYFDDIPEFNLELQDNEWKFEYTDHDRSIARAVVFDDEGYFYFGNCSGLRFSLK